mgnify:CR=1 FL=1
MLSHRGKYKCAKCGKLFLQKEINDKTFRQWNVKQRELDMHNVELENKQRKDNLAERRTFLGFRGLFKEKKQRVKLSQEERKQRKLETDRIWRENNRERVSLNSKLWLDKNKDKKLAYLKLWRKNNQEKARLKQRISYWRLKQAKLAQQQLEINSQNPYIDDLDNSFSTFGLTNLLFKLILFVLMKCFML